MGFGLFRQVLVRESYGDALSPNSDHDWFRLYVALSTSATKKVTRYSSSSGTLHSRVLSHRSVSSTAVLSVHVLISPASFPRAKKKPTLESLTRTSGSKRWLLEMWSVTSPTSLPRAKKKPVLESLTRTSGSQRWLLEMWSVTNPAATVGVPRSRVQPQQMEWLVVGYREGLRSPMLPPVLVPCFPQCCALARRRG